MNIIFCIDDKNGISFNKRRQSRDEAVCKRILQITGAQTLRMSEESEKLFVNADITAQNDFLENAQKGDFCFAENDSFIKYLDKVEKVIIYRWNRVYPSDVKINTDFLKTKNKVSAMDFEGNSHQKITEEIYE